MGGDPADIDHDASVLRRRPAGSVCRQSSAMTGGRLPVPKGWSRASGPRPSESFRRPWLLLKSLVALFAGPRLGLTAAGRGPPTLTWTILSGPTSLSRQRHRGHGGDSPGQAG